LTTVTIQITVWDVTPCSRQILTDVLGNLLPSAPGLDDSNLTQVGFRTEYLPNTSIRMVLRHQPDRHILQQSYYYY